MTTKLKTGHFAGKMEGGTLTVDSDCINSNHHSNNSYLSDSSSQDFVQDNSDYQWFLDYGYRDGSGANHHTSILSLPESYEALNDVNYYEALAKNMDANLAEADMESFRTEDIHELLTNLPPMCTNQSSQETNRQGESFASVSGSMMAKFDFDSSHSTSHDDSTNSIYASELLFSPVKEMPLFGPNYSVDSLDCDMMLTCQANKDNYTIAFEGSVTMYSEDSDYHEMERSMDRMPKDHHAAKQPTTTTSMTQSDSGSFTTWSNLQKQTTRSGNNNNNNNSNENIEYPSTLTDTTVKSHSMPNLYKQKLLKRTNRKTDQMQRSVRVFDIQNSHSENMATSDGNTKHHPNLNLVKLFMKQKSASTEGMSTTMDQLSSTENNWAGTSQSESNHSEQLKNCGLIAEEPEEDSLQNSCSNNNNSADLISKSIQTSHFSEVYNLKKSFHSVNKTQQQYKVMEGSFLNKLKQTGQAEKPVYVLYPNYVLPNLDFLQSKPASNLFLVPQKAPTVRTSMHHKRRPFSFNDVEMLKKKGFDHIKDWDSLNILLPQEYRQILCKQQLISRTSSDSKSSNKSYSSSGYKGSSTILNDSQNNSNPLFVYRYDSVTSSEASCVSDSMRTNKPITTAPPLPVRCVSLQHDHHRIPPRPPLPKGIMRKKRWSYEASQEDLKNHQEPLKWARRPRFSETEDEGVDAGTSSSSLDEPREFAHPTKTDFLLSNIGLEELAQFEEFLKLSGICTSDTDDFTEESFLQLRSHVSAFLSLKMNSANRRAAPNNSPNISTFLKKNNLADMPICEESESPNSYSPVHTKHTNTLQTKLNDITESVRLITSQFSLCDTTELVLNHLCPSLYSLLSEGLKPNLETSFGAINNSVWQVVEASAQQGPLTKALNELVMRINAEDVITEGLVKFNAFVFGLLNVRSLDAWISYLRTRETILKKHYTCESLWVLANTGGGSVRNLLDKLVAGLQPLALLPFQLDLLYEYKQLHASFRRLEQLSPCHVDLRLRKERPRSCIDGATPKLNFKLDQVSKKRWSGIPSNSKLYLAYDKIASEDEYTDSLEPNTKEATPPEPESLDTKPINGRRFKKLQQKWEKISGDKVVTSPVSKIPRPITSPCKPSGIPVLVSPTGKPNSGNNKQKISRTSRVDLEKDEQVQKHAPRPSSLPYKTSGTKQAKVMTPRRAASSSASRKTTGTVPKYVKTLSHRLPSESGHLAYNEGERLKVVLQVDDKWLLCCRGFQKGLVPKSAVISADSPRFT